MTDIDALTGLPELPEGWRFQIVANYDKLWITVAQQRTRSNFHFTKRRWWQTQIRVETKELFWDYPSIFHESKTVEPDDVLAAANKCASDLDARLARYALVGNYPPKKPGVKADV